MKVIIEICDDGENYADITVKFDPRLTDKTCHAPASQMVREMLQAIPNEVEVKVDG